MGRVGERGRVGGVGERVSGEGEWVWGEWESEWGRVRVGGRGRGGGVGRDSGESEWGREGRVSGAESVRSESGGE